MTPSTRKLIKTPLDTLTYRLNLLAMEVHSELKPGRRARVYQRRLAERVTADGMRVEVEKVIEVFVNETLVGYMYLDLWVEDCLVVECQAHSHAFSPEDIGQGVTSLAATGSLVGLLYNFGRTKLEFKRIRPAENVQEWHKHLYRCIWTPPGHALPPLDSITPETPIRFSIRSQPVLESSVSNRFSAAHPLEASSAYASSGVNIASGNRAVKLMSDAVRATYGPEVLGGIGSFGGLFNASALKGMNAPVLVASTDGVGTKVKLAAQAGRYVSIGQDIVNHCINDILVQGARPLFFLDYVASSKLDPERMAEIVTGMATACQVAGCALLGGETAEMPGVYAPNEFDVAGTIVGVVERANILPRPTLQAGDVLIGLRSTGPHTNGYSLIRRVFEGLSLDTVFPELDAPLADALLAPHRSYLQSLGSTLHLAKALAHLTGGGFIENIPRSLPAGLGATIRLGSWPVPPLFQLIQQRGDIATTEMYRVFNMGIGMIVMASAEDLSAVRAAIPEETFIIGKLETGDKQVTLV